MNELFNKSELISALQAGGLGLTIGAIFALIGFKPPSPDNLGYAPYKRAGSIFLLILDNRNVRIR